MNKYEVLGVVGEGAYGVVLRCRNKDSGCVVAVKKFKESEDDEIVKKTTLREVKVLRMLRHPNIVCLKEAFRRKGKLYLVFEYVEKNLLEVLEDNPDGLPFEAVRGYIHQLCRAIDWCHHNGVVHRDIKPENLLINARSNELKLCDFGFARIVPQPSAHRQELTDYVATRWYRAPELLLGSTRYDPSVDLWAIGCIMGELVDGQPLFPGDSEIDQLYIVQRMLGPLTEAHVQLFLKNPRFVGLKFPDMSRPETLQKRFVGKLGKRAMAFMRSALAMDPSARVSSREAVCHSLFEGLFEDYASRHPHLQQRGDDVGGGVGGGTGLQGGNGNVSGGGAGVLGGGGGGGVGGAREDPRRTGGGGSGLNDQQPTTYLHGNGSGVERHPSLEGDVSQQTPGPKPPSGGVPRLGRFTRQGSQQQQQQQHGNHHTQRSSGAGDHKSFHNDGERGGGRGSAVGSSNWGNSNTTRGGGWDGGRGSGSGSGSGSGGSNGHRRGSGYTGQGAGANRHSRENSRQPTGREDGGRTGGGSNGDGGGGNSGGGGRRAGGRTGRDSSGGKGRYGGGGSGGGGGRGTRPLAASTANGSTDINNSSRNAGSPIHGNDHRHSSGSTRDSGILYGGEGSQSQYNRNSHQHEQQHQQQELLQQQQHQNHQQPLPASAARDEQQWHTSQLPGFARSGDGGNSGGGGLGDGCDDRDRKGHGYGTSRDGRDRDSKDSSRDRNRHRDGTGYRDSAGGGAGFGREGARGDFGGRDSSREANNRDGGGGGVGGGGGTGGRRGPAPLKGLHDELGGYAEPKATPRGGGRFGPGDPGGKGVSPRLDGGGAALGRSVAAGGRVAEGKQPNSRRWKGDSGGQGAAAEEKRQLDREIQAERERQRENEIRAFRDFSLNLSSTPLRPSLGSQAGDDHDDGNYPRGPPKRAEYKTGVGVNLDALRDPSLAPRSRGRDTDPLTGGRDSLASTGGNVSGTSAGSVGGASNASRRFFGVGGEPGGGGNGGSESGAGVGGGGGGPVGSSPSTVSARYPPLEHIQNPPQPDPKAVADMNKFPGPHASGGGSSSGGTGGGGGGGGGPMIGKPSPLGGCYPISPLHVKRRSSSNSNSNPFSAGVGAVGVGLGEDKLEAKAGISMGMGLAMGMGSDNLDGGYLPQLRRNEGRGGEGAGC